tara:strand:- start:794 stop:1837 length:1044 start_codon:yes stop_codon:yes gene_type:complete
MGGSGSKAESTIKQENNTTIVNSTDIEMLNQMTNEQISNTIMEDAKKCQASVLQDQKISIRNVNTDGDFNLSDVSQIQDAAVTFSCVNATEVAQKASTKMVDSIMTSLDKNVSNDILAELEAKADAATKSGFGSIANGDAESSSNVENINNTSVTNTTNVNLKNIVTNTVVNNFSSKNVSECIAQINNSQEIAVENINAGGDVNIRAVSQKQSASLMAECIQNSKVSNGITNDLSRILGVEVKETTSTTSASSSKGEATAKAEQTGPIEEIGDAVSNVMGSIFGNQMMMSVICIVIVIIIAGCGFMMMSGGMGDIGGMSGGVRKFFGGKRISNTKNYVPGLLKLLKK